MHRGVARAVLGLLISLSLSLSPHVSANGPTTSRRSLLPFSCEAFSGAQVPHAARSLGARGVRVEWGTLRLMATPLRLSGGEGETAGGLNPPVQLEPVLPTDRPQIVPDDGITAGADVKGIAGGGFSGAAVGDQMGGGADGDELGTTEGSGGGIGGGFGGTAAGNQMGDETDVNELGTTEGSGGGGMAAGDQMEGSGGWRTAAGDPMGGGADGNELGTTEGSGGGIGGGFGGMAAEDQMGDGNEPGTMEGSGGGHAAGDDMGGGRGGDLAARAEGVESLAEGEGKGGEMGQVLSPGSSTLMVCPTPNL